MGLESLKEGCMGIGGRLSASDKGQGEAWSRDGDGVGQALVVSRKLPLRKRT